MQSHDRKEPEESLEQLSERLEIETTEILRTGRSFITHVDDHNSQLKWRVHPGFYAAYGVRRVFKESIFLTSAT